jgi:hypothetical protein
MAKEEKINGKVNGTANGKANGTKVIPKETWKAFYEFWDNTEYEELDAKSIKELLGKHLFVPLPKDVRNRTAIDKWYKEIKSFKEKGKGGFGDYRINPAQMTKILHLYINDHYLASKGSEPKVETNGNGKKTIKVNSIQEMEKAVEKIGKKGK